MSIVLARILNQSFINHNTFVRFEREGKDHSEETVHIYQTGKIVQFSL